MPAEITNGSKPAVGSSRTISDVRRTIASRTASGTDPSITTRDTSVTATALTDANARFQETFSIHDGSTSLAIGPEDVAKADAYEVADYCRIAVTLASGRYAYVYVAAEDASTT